MIDAIAAALLFASAGWLAVLVVGLACLPAVRAAGRPALRGLLRILHRPGAQAMLIAAMASLVASITVFAIRGEPFAYEHDEFAHLLVADTLREGRLANPPHPMRRHLESPVALQEPAYASKYPLGNGFLIAMAGAILGLPIAGIWLASAAASAATVWAARAWLPPAWALLAGLAIALHPTFTAWGTAYQRGSLPAFGGALLLGATVRLCRRPSAGLAAIAAAALVILALIRPFEGLVFAIAMAIFVLLTAPRVILQIVRVSAPAAVILAAGMALIAAHNRAVTGSFVDLPHLLHDGTYQRAPNFVWEAPYPPRVHESDEMRVTFVAYASFHDRLVAPGGWWRVGVVDKLDTIRAVAFPPSPGGAIGSSYPLQYLPLLILPWALRRRRQRLLLLVVGLCTLAPLAVVQPVLGQYVAPAAAVAAILYVLLARELVVRFPSPAAALVLATIVFCALAGIQAVFVTARSPQPPPAVERQAVLTTLERLPGQHLVLVPDTIDGCLFNAADIDGARIVWARQLDPRSDAELLRYFRGRRVWQLLRTGDGMRVQERRM